MSERYTEEWVAHLLDAAGRFGGADPGAMLRGLGVTAGLTVVDYGCGPGLFTLAAARLVGAGGKVYAVDLEPRMIELVAARAAQAGLTNVAAVAGDGRRAALPDGVADFIICVQILHYQKTRAERVAVARDLNRLLKIMQWQPKHGASGVPYSALAAIMRDAGLITAGMHPITGELYRTLARKRSAAGAAGGR